MNSDITSVLSTLTSAVEVILSPTSPPADRQRAHQICDDFKETSPLCIQCGLVLAEKQYSPIIRHFGLQLLEHCIKFRWTSMSQDEKAMLKSSSLSLIAKGTGDLLSEQPHIKDAVSRLVVEIMKHDWPNHWTSLLADLYNLCLVGNTQTELVLKVFLRLVEDIVIFQNLHHQRRREIMTALNGSIAEVFDLFISLLQEHTNRAQALSNSETNETVTVQSHLKVSEMTLMTLSGYLDWVPMSQLIMKDSLLLQMLCLLLGNPTLQLPSAECLLIIVSRKGKVEERKPLLILFHEGAMSTIWNAAVMAENSQKDDHFYLFLKRLCQILVELGKQLCVLWGSEGNPEIGQPPNFIKYLKALLAFTQHQSQMLSSLTQHLWATFLRHEHVSVDPQFIEFIPLLMETATKTLIKVGFPSQNNSISCDYARLDFDSDEEFNLFFSKYRAEISETLRQATLIKPTIAFNYAKQWLKVVLDKPLDIGSGDDKGSNCKLNSPSFLEWDALTTFLESVMSKLDLDKQPQSDVQDGINLLKAVLSYQTQDPLILSCLLSCISALFTCLKYAPDMLPAVIQKIFSAVVFNQPGQTKATRSKAVKNVRQHACSGLVKICKQYKHLVFPVFDELYNHIQEISRDPDQLSQMEKCILVEATILISNEFNNFEKQQSFLEEVMKPVKELWLSDEFNKAFWSTEKLMSYVGLDQAPVEPSSADTCGINRSHITYCINMILAVMKRSKWPQDDEKAQAGGFVIGKKTTGELIMRSPATSHISVLLENVLALLRAMNMLWCDEFLKLRHPDFMKSYDLPESEKLVLLGIPPACVDTTGSPICKQPLERMQNFLTTTHDMSCHILGNIGMCMGSEIYQLPTLSQSMVATVLSYLDVLPDYRLRPLIRVFVKSFVQHCPSQYYTTAIVPILSHICPYMYQRLGFKWQLINQRCQTRTETDEENPESQEVLDEHLTRQLTRDYYELLYSVCINRRTEPVEDRVQDENEAVPCGTGTLGELGVLCAANESICEPLVLSVLNGMTWNDSPTLNKCLGLCYPLIKQLVADNNLSSAAATHCYRGILSTLQIHGHQESSQSALLGLGVHVYELLRPLFTEIQGLMLQIPGCKEAALKAFDEKLLSATSALKLGDKKKRDIYKNLVRELIGKNVCEQFKREVHYNSLPNLFRRHRPKQPSLDEIESKDIGLCELFKPEQNGIR